MSDEYRSRQERRKAQTKAQSKKSNKINKGGLFKKIVLALCIVIGLGIIGGGIAVYAIIQDAPELKPALLDSPLTTTIYDKDNHKVETIFGTQNRVKVNISDVPKTLKQAFVSIEDRRFYDHFGIDIRRIVGAAIEDIQHMAIVEGGSTITQQVIKRAILSPKQTFVRKIQEAWLAIQLEQKYSKDQILEMYINKIFFGQNAYGVKTASITYFGIKDLSKLNLSQMALLAGIPNAPTAYNPFEHPENAAERRNLVLNAMVETGAITKEQAQKASSIPVTDLLKEQDTEQTPPYYGAFIDKVYKELKDRGIVKDRTQFRQSGLKVYTTLDSKAQQKVYHLLKSDEIPFPNKYFQAGLALTDTQSGAIRAIGGGRDYTSSGSAFNFGIDSNNSPGSNIKPVLDYGPAVEYLKWSTYHQIVDEPYDYPGTDKSVGEWDGEYWGEMSIRRALAWSRNVPAVKTFHQTKEEVGEDKVRKFAESIGIPIDNLFPSSALGGGIGVSPLQMAGAYAAFGNQGVYHEPYSVRKVVFPNGKTVEFDHKPEVAMHRYTAYMITDMLKTVLNSGTGQMADIPGLPVAGKTGSTQIPDDIVEKYNIQKDGYMDEWFTGYTTQYSISVWTGYKDIDVNGDGDPEFISFEPLENSNLDSTDLAKLIFKKLMMSISDEDVSDWEMPDSVKKVAIEEDSGLLPSEDTPEDQIVTELFVEGTQPTKVSNKFKQLEAPKNLKAQYDEKKKQIIVTWDYPEKKENIGFKVGYSADGQTMQNLGTVGKTKVIINNPDPGSAYQIQVTAVNSESKKQSDPVTTTVQISEEKTALVPPQQLQATYNENSSHIQLTWAYPERENTLFKVEVSVNGQPMQNVGSTKQTKAVIKDPQPGVYRFRVTPIDTTTNKAGPPAETTVTVTEAVPEEPPGNGNDDDNTGNGNDSEDGETGTTQGENTDDGTTQDGNNDDSTNDDSTSDDGQEDNVNMP
ncbi:MAG TPA: PBP1A family penicillin-binding protein [Bacillales bacterium]|nr:PBP1A family penicillin-binding protein [Bacillales bacterium]